MCICIYLEELNNQANALFKSCSTKLRFTHINLLNQVTLCCDITVCDYDEHF